MRQNSPKRYKIAMVAACAFPANHGSPASIREMSWALSEIGHEVHIVTYPISQEIPVQGCTVHRIPRIQLHSRVTVGPSFQRIFFDIFMIFKLYQVVRREKIDIIHAHNYEGALVGIVVKILTGKPLLYNAVNTMGDELPSYNFIRPRVLAVKIARLLDLFVPKGADYITVVSSELFAILLDQGISPKKMKVVPAGVIPEMFEGRNENSVRVRCKLGSSPIVIYTGTLDEFQRIDYLLKAMKIVISTYQDAKALLIVSTSKPSDDESCLKMARDLGIAGNVLIAHSDPLKELPDYLASANVAVLPRPTCPGHPVKLLNYMAAGKGIVAFKGAAKGLKHRVNGWLVEDHNWEELAQGIIRLIKEPALAKSLGERARHTVKTEFDWRVLAKGISVIYEGIMNRTTNGAISIDLQQFDRFVPKC